MRLSHCLIKFCLPLLCTIFNVHSQEQIFLNTDRDIYIINEELWFNLAAYKSDSNECSHLSKVVYIELLNENNLPIKQVKCHLKDGLAQSYFVLPDTLSTGKYLVRAYTRWMNNFSEGLFAKKIVSVINPFVVDEHSVLRSTDNQVVKERCVSSNNQINIKLSSDNFGLRDKVSVNIDNVADYQLNSVCVSVVKSCLIDDFSVQAKSINSINSDESSKVLIPEVKGELLTGNVYWEDSKEPVVDEKMMLSFLSDIPTLQLSNTDSLGGFIFEINRTGKEEMVIQPIGNDSIKMKYGISINDAFSKKYGATISSDFEVDSVKLKELNNAIINMQISSIYGRYSSKLFIQEMILGKKPFYEEPDVITVIDNFIDLPTIEDVIREIVPFTTLRKVNGKNIFKVFENSSLYPKDGETMVFLDGVPVYDIDNILVLNPNDLLRVEVVNFDYYLEDEKLGRLLCFFTNNCDMAGYEFDSRIFRQVHKGYLPNYHFTGPNYEDSSNVDERIPDFRNLLFYNLYEKIEPNGTINASFYTSDESTEFTIIVRALDINGKVVELRSEFSVE